MFFEKQIKPPTICEDINMTQNWSLSTEKNEHINMLIDIIVYTKEYSESPDVANMSPIRSRGQTATLKTQQDLQREKFM